MLALLAAFALQAPSIEAILADPRLSGATVAVTVADEQGKVGFDRNGDRRVTPGSNQKLLTAAFALETLGPRFALETKVWKETDRIVIDAPGDPFISHDQWQATVRRVGGPTNLPVAVRQAYRVGVPDTWEFDDLPNRYAAQVTALTAERGGFELWAKGGKLELRPAALGVRLDVRGGTGALRTRFDPFQRVVVAEGKVPDGEVRVDTLAIPDPDQAVASLFGGLMVTTDRLPERTPDATILGRTIGEMVSFALPPSDNQVCEHLLLLAGGGTYTRARAAMRGFLESKVGVSPGDITVFDGSGMSRHNAVTSRALVQLLAWARRQPTAPLWNDALAKAGQTGTLANRLRGVRFSGKTGTLNSVSALSGYVTTASGEVLLVSIVMNQYRCTAAEARELQDALVRALAGHNQG